MRARRALLVAAALAGCSEEPSGPGVDSHVQYYDFPGMVPQHLDVLIVVDATTAMQPYQTALSALAPGAEADLYGENTTMPDARFAVTTADGTGQLRQASSTTDPFLAISYDAQLRLAYNFTGTLSAALGELVAVGASASSNVTPLEAAKQALDANPTFVRESSVLGVVTITASDDASAGQVVDYATSLAARHTDPSRVAVSGVYPQPATRLDAFHAAFPNRTWTADIATADLAGVLGDFTTLFRSPLGLACATEPADVDPNTNGPQYDCDLNAYYDDGTTQAVRACAAVSTGPCFEFLVEPNCMDPALKRFQARGFGTPYVPTIRGQCVVTGGN